MFFKKKEPAVEQPSPTDVYEELRAKYVMFCRNPLRTMRQVENEFDALIHNTEHLTSIGFRSSTVMKLSTDEVFIKHPQSGATHTIGSFTIFIVRKRTGRIWEVDFRFRNTTREIYRSKKDMMWGSGYMHPHIVTEYHDDLDVENGRLCISRGGYEVHQHIRRGEIHQAAPLLINILHTYDHNTPFHHLGNWPTQEEINHGTAGKE